MTMSIPVNNDIRSEGTNTYAGHGFPGIFEVGRSFSFLQVKLMFNKVQDSFSSTDMTGSAPAYLDDIFSPRSGIKLLIESDHSLYLAREQAKPFRYVLYYGWRNITQQFLYILETGNQPPLFILVFRDNIIDFFQFSLC